MKLYLKFGIQSKQCFFEFTNVSFYLYRKAARAALILLPLLGTTNILNMIEVPLTGSVWRFATWSYITHFLRSFQGFFLAVIYCFSNGEVSFNMIYYYACIVSLSVYQYNFCRPVVVFYHHLHSI